MAEGRTEEEVVVVAARAAAAVAGMSIRKIWSQESALAAETRGLKEMEDQRSRSRSRSKKNRRRWGGGRQHPKEDMNRMSAELA
jgi:hypothetical protein